jgi:hypothetical protein
LDSVAGRIFSGALQISIDTYTPIGVHKHHDDSHEHLAQGRSPEAPSGDFRENRSPGECVDSESD